MGNTEFDYHVARIMALGPSLLVILVGVVLSLRNLPKYPRPCWVLLLALAIDGLSNLGLPIVMQTIMQVLSLNNPGQNHVLWTVLWTLPYSVVNAVIWCLVLFAVFDRPPQPKFLVEDDPDRDILDSPSGGR